ncbi:MAG TPA: S1/P1 nuclease [Phycisphaerae bacterium]|mgnify:CR=1 FL=1|jgi:hypothetical protein|nr:S1/P1 nuclease [Phycisphaerae bacterium]HOB76596.1 S1/P1 nuclease [Phycisphaerae bacterium]HOJ56663.1 S1/P1 nuclease [Phycisphaerae bacterium]HOL28391.1 S1/P1 nuclease [Phycisphaerae bacterium]HPP22843.1 S1/P1 nuclease [Phycisphaerae bacterium]
MSCKSRFGLIVVVLFSMSALCFGWGDTGHKAAAQIAAERLTPEARKAVRELLGEQSMADVARWADEVRGESRYKWSARLHTAKISPGFDTFDSKRDCPEKGCAVSAVGRFAAVLRDPSADKEQKVEALKFLIHFVGDVHQPVHVTGDGTKGVTTEVDFFGEKVGYHKMWDSAIIDKGGKSWQQYAKELQKRITEQQVKEWSKLDPALWATESYRINCRGVQAMPKDKRITQEYCDKFVPMLEERVCMAGVRLALLLNDIYANPTTQPAQPAAAAAPALVPAGR